MRFAVESWSPDYGAPSAEEAMAESLADVDPFVEVPSEAEWRPLTPGSVPAPPFRSIAFVDGVRRVEANIWLTDDDGRLHAAICASYASGAVLCDTTARVVSAEVRRGLFSDAPGADPIVSRHGRFDFHRSGSGDPQALSLALQRMMTFLEGDVAREVLLAHDPGVLVVDGPLREGHDDPDRMIGYVKTHARSYGPPVVQRTVAGLARGERTPVFGIDGRIPKLSCYLRLPVDISHGWSGIVRLEASADQLNADAIASLDRLSTALPRFASTPHKDPRAPQNLSPIGGLERELRRRLGDPAVLYRALLTASRSAAADGA